MPFHLKLLAASVLLALTGVAVVVSGQEPGGRVGRGHGQRLEVDGYRARGEAAAATSTSSHVESTSQRRTRARKKAKCRSKKGKGKGPRGTANRERSLDQGKGKGKGGTATCTSAPTQAPTKVPTEKPTPTPPTVEPVEDCGMTSSCLVQFTCFDIPGCVCRATTEGGSVCVTDNDECGSDECATSANCASNERCIPRLSSECCNQNECRTLCE